MTNQDKVKSDQDRDEVLKRMLKMKPKPHKKVSSKKKESSSAAAKR